ncbi:MAG TPA: hypothetical protein PK807_05910 [Verrucomicrobiota bacterium]|jgi:hypothetical protein|nr:hypothetical protein [Verrucomicrobiota bacterium]
MTATATRQTSPAYWKVAPGVVWIQVHQPEQARALARIAGGRRVAYSVAGPYLRTFEFARSVRWAERWANRQVCRQTGTNEGFSVLAAPLAMASAGNGCGQPVRAV